MDYFELDRSTTFCYIVVLFEQPLIDNLRRQL